VQAHGIETGVLDAGARRCERCFEHLGEVKHAVRTERLGTLVLLLPALAAGCGSAGEASAFSPAGPAARAVMQLGWVLLALSTFVVLLVLGLLIFALFRRRDGAGEAPADRRSTLRWILAGGVVFPFVTLTPLFVFALRTLERLAPREAPADLIVEVTGRQFWWEVHYRERGGPRRFETANEIHIPVGRAVQIRLQSADVIHSFWVPRLAPKVDNVPGRTTELWLQADAPGVYRGQCAEYCGTQHAHMAFLVIAETEEAFRSWMAEQERPAAESTDSLAIIGRNTFLAAPCRECHAVRGTPAAGNAGPDLTHVASRQTLAAGLLPNTPGHLAGWLADPQALKPGNLMPSVPLEAAELEALLRYLSTLR
jgi:cytochrome c oxidase subunit 2